MKDKFPLELAEKLQELKGLEAFEGFVDLTNQCIEKWRKNLSLFQVENDSMEMIAKKTIRWQCMIAGVETLFVQMDSLITELKEKQNAGDE